MSLLFLCLLAVPVQDKPQQPGSVPVLQDLPVLSRLFRHAGDATPKTVDEAVNLALAHHPDIKLAEAELRVAEAKLIQARMLVTRKTSEDFHKLAQAQKALKDFEAKMTITQQKHDAGTIPASAILEVQAHLRTTKSQVAQLETDFKMAVNPTNKSCAACHSGVNPPAWPSLMYPHFNHWTLQDAGTISIRTGELKVNASKDLSQFLDKPIKLEKQSDLSLEQAFDMVAKQAGMNLRVKLPVTENKTLYRDVSKISLPAEELPFRTWLQLIVDEYNTYNVMLAGTRKESVKRFDLYIREYGLLLTSSDLAPPDALTLQQYIKVQSANAARKDK